MEIIFLGTSSGTPTKSRNVSAVVIKKNNSKAWSLIDCGEGTQHQILHTNLSLKSLDTIYITHIHGDHCYGLPGLLASATMAGRVDKLRIVAPKEVKLFVETMQKQTELRLSYGLEFIVNQECKELNDGSDFDIKLVELSHRVPSWGFVFEEKGIENKLNAQKLIEDNIPKGAVWGLIQKNSQVTLEDNRVIESKNYYLPKREPRRVAISGDNANATIWSSVKGLDLLVHEATYTDEVAVKALEVGHSTAKDVATFARNYRLKNLILTHFSPRYQDSVKNSNDSSILDIESEAKEFYDLNLFLAHDFALYKLDKDCNIKHSSLI